MSSKKLFSNKSSNKSTSNKVIKAANTTNEAGGAAYSLSDKAALAQYAMTGCLNNTFYATDQDQLNKVLELSKKVDTPFLAKLAIYSRQKGLMKDMPALLTAIVASRDSDLLTKIFPKVIDNPKMLRNFVQIMRSGATGRKSLGTRPKKLVQAYLEGLTDEQLFKADVGNDPSLPDIIKMLHPRPSNKKRNAMYAYLLGKEYAKRDLNPLAKQFEDFKKDMTKEIPNVPFQMLTALPLTDEHWKSIAKNATWTQVRMNLNTFARHNVLSNSEIVSSLAEKLSDPDQVRRAKAFPYQLFTAHKNIDSNVPMKLDLALQKAADLALTNIPEFNGKVYVLVDTSGSMRSPVTGYRGSVTTKTSCVDVAALIASAVLRKNPDAEVIPFDTSVHQVRMNPLDSVITNSQVLAKFGGGGTDCACALRHLNKNNAKGSLIIMVSDNESWFSANSYYRGTGVANEWLLFKNRNPDAKFVCLDITPNSTTQVNSQPDVLNLGGFSDTCFEVIKEFMEFGNDKDLWIKTIESVDL